jgi:hypothetical protein
MWSGRTKIFLEAKIAAKKIFLAKHYNSVMMTTAATNYRSFIKVDEVDGRSPVERAAATFCTEYPTCVDILPSRLTNSS